MEITNGSKHGDHYEADMDGSELLSQDRLGSMAFAATFRSEAEVHPEFVCRAPYNVSVRSCLLANRPETEAIASARWCSHAA